MIVYSALAQTSRGPFDVHFSNAPTICSDSSRRFNFREVSKIWLEAQGENAESDETRKKQIEQKWKRKSRLNSGLMTKNVCWDEIVFLLALFFH